MTLSMKPPRPEARLRPRSRVRLIRNSLISRPLAGMRSVGSSRALARVALTDDFQAATLSIATSGGAFWAGAGARRCGRGSWRREGQSCGPRW